MRLLTLVAAIPAVCAVTLAAGCTVRLGDFTSGGGADCWTEADERFDLSASGIDCIVITTHNGRIEVAAGGGDDSTIQVTAHKRAGGDDAGEARDALHALVIRREQRGATLELASEWSERRDDDWQAKVDFVVTVPARLAAHLESHNGDLLVSGLRGAVDLETRNGDIAIRSACGRIRAESHNGTVECCADGQPIDLSTHNGDLKFATAATCVSGSITTHNGDIELDLPSGANGTIEGRGRFGRHAFTGNVDSTLVIDGRDFKVMLGDAHAARLHVTTRNGRIELR